MEQAAVGEKVARASVMSSSESVCIPVCVDAGFALQNDEHHISCVRASDIRVARRIFSPVRDS